MGDLGVFASSIKKAEPRVLFADGLLRVLGLSASAVAQTHSIIGFGVLRSHKWKSRPVMRENGGVDLVILMKIRAEPAHWRIIL